MADMTFKVKLLPSTDLSSDYTLGSSSKRWKIFGDLTGTLNGYYTASTDSPVLTVRANNVDVPLFQLGHATSATDAFSNHYRLVYKGTGSSPNNYLQLIANTSSTDTIAMQVNENGNVSFTNTVSASISGNAATATKLATARTLTIGSTGKTFDGSENVSWSHAEIGATVSNTWTGGNTAGPTIKTTVNGVTGTAVAIPSASASASGVVTTGAQTFAGIKTFTNPETINTTGNGAAVNFKFSDAASANGIYGQNWISYENTSGRFNWREWSGSSSGRTSYYEQYRLPACNASRTSNETYNILTTKNTITVAQGGTGNTSFTSGRMIYASSATKLSGTPYMHFSYTAGTTSAVGKEELVIGNSTASGTENNAYGMLSLYSQGTKGTYLISATNSTDWYVATLQAKTGTIALTSDLSAYVKKAGDTMTGDLTIQGGTSSSSARINLNRYDGSVTGFVGYSRDSTKYGLYIAGTSPVTGYLTYIDTSSGRVYYRDSYNTNSVSLAYSQSALAYANYDYLAGWNGYELRAIAKTQFAQASHNHYQLVTEGDNRTVATTPDSYNNNLVFRGLKTNTSFGSPSSDAYSYVVGLRGWRDSSGGNAYELAFNNTGIFCRKGATTSWGSWDKIVTLSDGNSAYVKKAGDSMTGSLTIQAAGDTYVWVKNSSTGNKVWLDAGGSANHGIWSDGYYNNSTFTSSGKWIIYRGSDGEAHTGMKLYGAVWNDYAEYRITKDKIEPGRCVIETGKDDLVLSTERLQPGAEIVSDTFGFAIGETDDAKTPIATTGRVLAYIYEGREAALAAIGKPVCSGPNGTVSIMTDEEYQKYGYCAIGAISAVPDYEEWGTGKVKVNNRIWIRIR